MQNPADITAPAATSDAHRLLAASLHDLIGQIETSMRLIDAAMTLEQSSDQPAVTDVIVLDDVTPRYARAGAVLSACRATLALALRCLSDSGEPFDAPPRCRGGRI